MRHKTKSTAGAVSLVETVLQPWRENAGPCANGRLQSAAGSEAGARIGVEIGGEIGVEIGSGIGATIKATPHISSQKSTSPCAQRG